MRPARTALFTGTLVAGALVALLFPVALALADDPEVKRVARLEVERERAEEVARPARPLLALDALPCFGCHNIDRYHTGERMPHDSHVRAGHCHVCHAFLGHVEVRTRREACERCH